MVSINPWRPCHCTGLLLHALLANCWKKKNALGRGQKFTAQCMLGHLILLSNSNLLRRPRWSLIKAEMKGRQKTGLALVSCSFQTFMRRLFILSQLLTDEASKDTWAQVQLLQKNKECRRQMKLKEGDFDVFCFLSVFVIGDAGPAQNVTNWQFFVTLVSLLLCATLWSPLSHKSCC